MDLTRDGDPARMPGHWLLARVGKRVLRPGGRSMTEAMLAALEISSADRVVERSRRVPSGRSALIRSVESGRHFRCGER
jgi:hypothetical protein